MLISVAFDVIETTGLGRNNKSLCYVIELFSNSFFGTELLLKIISSPNRSELLTQFLTWIDIVIIVPYFLLLALVGSDLESLEFLHVLRIFRVFRILRVFRLTQYFGQVNSAALILKDSLKDLQLFCLTLFIIITFGAAVMYHIENSIPDTEFKSVLHCMWWAIQTFLPVGYGDIVPQSSTGKFFSCMYMIFGVTSVSLPVLSLTMKFVAFYSFHNA